MKSDHMNEPIFLNLGLKNSEFQTSPHFLYTQTKTDKPKDRTLGALDFGKVQQILCETSGIFSKTNQPSDISFGLICKKTIPVQICQKEQQPTQFPMPSFPFHFPVINEANQRFIRSQSIPAFSFDIWES